MKRRERDNRRVRVLGIDPGSQICGYGIIDEVDKKNKGQGDYSYVASGRIELSSGTPLHVRLNEIYSALAEIIQQYHPGHAAVERIFFAKSVKAALHLGHARGVSMLAATAEGLQVYEYSAVEVKKAVVGYGRAEKSQVQAMVKTILNLRSALSPDSADALALSICHLNMMRLHPYGEEVLQTTLNRPKMKNWKPQAKHR